MLHKGDGYEVLVRDVIEGKDRWYPLAFLAFVQTGPQQTGYLLWVLLDGKFTQVVGDVRRCEESPDSKSFLTQ